MSEATKYSGHIVRVSRGPIDHYGIIDRDGTIWEHGGKDAVGVRRVTLPEFSRGLLVKVIPERRGGTQRRELPPGDLLASACPTVI